MWLVRTALLAGSLFLLKTGSCQTSFSEPTQYELEDGGDYYLNMSYCPFNVENEFNFTGRCWCWYTVYIELISISLCSVNAPNDYR